MIERDPKGDIICDFSAGTAPVTAYECDDFKLDSAAPVPNIRDHCCPANVLSEAGK
jgi:hypothetical protein